LTSRPGLRLTYYLLIIVLLCCSSKLLAQLQQPQGTFPVDTSMKKSNNADWKNDNVRINYKLLGSDKTYTPDTSIHTFHRRPFVQPWYRDLGNTGSPAQNLLFTPEYRVGPTLGYHVFDIYRFVPDSLRYYNTNRPYSVFSYRLGSKLEQVVDIMHTQNIKPNWNFSVQYRKINSPGFYQLQRSNNDNANLTTHYQSKNLHYELYGGIIYNKEQQDENGGILSDSLLSDPSYSNRELIPVRLAADPLTGSTVRRSAITNTHRDFSILLQHGYTIGKIDTLYNKDSTSYSLQLTPRFGIAHRLEISSEKYRYKDRKPDSAAYAGFFHHGFNATNDSLFTQQNWVVLDNRFSLNGFAGKRERQLRFNAGIGNRMDVFKTKFIIDSTKDKIISNYVIGGLSKENLQPGQWYYNAKALFYVTGDYAGNSLLEGTVGRDINKWISIDAGFRQELNSAPYNYTTYYNRYDTIVNSFNKESITTIYGAIHSDKLKLAGGIRSYLISNYVYLGANQLPTQNASSFNVTEIWLQKILTWRAIVLDNEIVFQQKTNSAPVNMPQLMGRHQLSIERYIFHRALKVATGIEVRYHSPYEPSGYSPFFNRFYYQSAYTLTNDPEGSVFFNFKVKNFRAYLMGDQVQQLFLKKPTINFPGYPVQNFMIRFGFNWVLIN
jgi:hypothetical protein